MEYSIALKRALAKDQGVDPDMATMPNNKRALLDNLDFGYAAILPNDGHDRQAVYAKLLQEQFNTLKEVLNDKNSSQIAIDTLNPMLKSEGFKLNWNHVLENMGTDREFQAYENALSVSEGTDLEPIQKLNGKTLEKSQDEKRLEGLENEITMLNSPDSGDLQNYLKDAGFIVKMTDRVSPDWDKDIGKEGLEKLSLPQIDELVRVAHKDLSKQIAVDVKKGISVEDAYMQRAATDPAATLIAEATVLRNEKKSNYEKEIEQLKLKTTVMKGFDKDFTEILNKQGLTTKEVNGLEQMKGWIKQNMTKEPEQAAKLAANTVNKLNNRKLDWKNPKGQADKLIESNKETTMSTKELKALSTKDFAELAAGIYVDKYNTLEKSGVKPGAASTVALATIKELAQKGGLIINLKNVSDKDLQKASASKNAVQEILKDNIKPSRISGINKSKDKDMER